MLIFDLHKGSTPTDAEIVVLPAYRDRPPPAPFKAVLPETVLPVTVKVNPVVGEAKP